MKIWHFKFYAENGIIQIEWVLNQYFQEVFYIYGLTSKNLVIEDDSIC